MSFTLFSAHGCMHLRWKVFQHDCASFSSLGEQDQVGCSGRMGLKQIMHSGNGGVESENVSMDVRSSPEGALPRWRDRFARLTDTDASVLGALMGGFDRPARRLCPDCPDACGLSSCTCEVAARLLAG